MLRLHGMQIAGNGGYDMGTEHMHGHIEGQDLAAVEVRDGEEGESRTLMGRVTWLRDANGTLTEPASEGECER